MVSTSKQKLSFMFVRPQKYTWNSIFLTRNLVWPILLVSLFCQKHLAECLVIFISSGRIQLILFPAPALAELGSAQLKLVFPISQNMIKNIRKIINFWCYIQLQTCFFQFFKAPPPHEKILDPPMVCLDKLCIILPLKWSQSIIL